MSQTNHMQVESIFLENAQLA